MGKMLVGVILSCSMVAGLVLASCAPAPAPLPTPTPAPMPKPAAPEKPAPPVKEKAMVKDSLGRLVEKPRYGGVLIECWGLEVAGFDPAFSSTYTCSTTPLTNEPLVGGDWVKGPSGTNDLSYRHNYAPPREHERGLLTESWELTNPQTIVYHIRKGVHWHDKPPMSGREVIADDVVFGIKYLATGTGIFGSYLADIESLTAADKRTVVVKCKPGKTGRMHTIVGHYSPILPREVIEKYKDMRDWRVSCGTGAFMLIDYLSNSSATFTKNPNYWMKNPLHPEDALPYVGGVKRLFIADKSTQLAAMRTGKVDLFSVGSSLPWEDAEHLIKTNPELKWSATPPSQGLGFGGKVTTPPYNDVRVRQALMLAIDHEAIARDYYKGKAEILTFPIPNMPDFKDVYVPLKELPISLRELYEYHPDKAKRLLAEAGYPHGFKTEVVCMKEHTDLLSLVQSYWARIGIELKIDIKERAIWVSMIGGKTHKHMIVTYVQPGDVTAQAALEKGVFYNTALVDDPRINEALAQIANAWPDSRKQYDSLRDIALHIIEQCYYVVLPGAYSYTFWQPWVKAYNGETYCGYMAALGHFSKYLWLDLDLKEKTTGRR